MKLQLRSKWEVAKVTREIIDGGEGLYQDCLGRSEIKKSEDVGKRLQVYAVMRICRSRGEETTA